MIDSGGMACPVEVSIDDHSLLVLSLDGNPIEPVEGNSNFYLSEKIFKFYRIHD